ncbi:MAG: ferritin [Gemmatimonadota bacterium]
MVSKEVQDAINAQIGREFFAAYLYLGMMSYFENRSLSGFGHWMRLQAQEEAAHAMRLVDFLLDRGGNVELQAIDRPVIEFDSPLSVMRAALAHEQKVTGTINDLYAIAVQHNDYPAQVLMQWFVSEQVEEEKNAGEIVDQLELAAGSGSALLVLDGRLAERISEEPAPEAQ